MSSSQGIAVWTPNQTTVIALLSSCYDTWRRSLFRQCPMLTPNQQGLIRKNIVTGRMDHFCIPQFEEREKRLDAQCRLQVPESKHIAGAACQPFFSKNPLAIFYFINFVFFFVSFFLHFRLSKTLVQRAGKEEERSQVCLPRATENTEHACRCTFILQ